jgi:hypothetical protein
LVEDPVVSKNGSLNAERLVEVLTRCWDGAARKNIDWIKLWQAMQIPLDRQPEAIQKFLNLAFVRTEDPDKAPLVIAELVKHHKIKMKSVEEVLVTFGPNLDGILAVNEEAWQLYSKFLAHVFPKPQGSGWGWSRVGWSWQSWWQFLEKCVQSLDGQKAFDVVCLVLRLIQDFEGTTLAEIQGWTEGDKLQRVLTKLCDLAGCECAEAIERLGAEGVMVEVA